MLRPLPIVALLVTTAPFGKAQWQLHDAHTTADLRGIHTSATEWRGPPAPTAPCCGRKTAAICGKRAPSRPAQRNSTSAASRPSTPTPPSSCPAAKATSPASTKPPTAATRGSSSSPTPTKTASGTRSGSAIAIIWLLGDPVDGCFSSSDPRRWRALDALQNQHPCRRPSDGCLRREQFVPARCERALLWHMWPRRTILLRGDTLCTHFTGKTTRTGWISDFTKFDPTRSRSLETLRPPVFSPSPACRHHLHRGRRATTRIPADRRNRRYFHTTSVLWAAAKPLPGGYRSAVAYDSTAKTWITVGPNGTDISTDDGRNWRALKPNPRFHDAPDADQHWNALSLPYVVGPHGRIATLRPTALTPSK